MSNSKYIDLDSRIKKLKEVVKDLGNAANLLI